jgi:hypothetical protein
VNAKGSQCRLRHSCKAAAMKVDNRMNDALNGEYNRPCIQQGQRHPQNSCEVYPFMQGDNFLAGNIIKQFDS